MYAARPHEQDQQRATLNIACSNSPYSVPRETSIQVSSPGNANKGRIGQYLPLLPRGPGRRRILGKRSSDSVLRKSIWSRLSV